MTKERPILFNAQMVRALLDGSKTQTRRVVNPQPSPDFLKRGVIGGAPVPQWPGQNGVRWFMRDGLSELIKSPYGQPGDRLWVREAWRTIEQANQQPPRDMDGGYRVWYEANGQHQPGFGKLRPSIHMPRWASRILLEIVGVRVERLQDISEADAMAEGAQWAACGTPQEGSHKAGYAQLWESINGPGSWEANPWVWVVEFRKAAP